MSGSSHWWQSRERCPMRRFERKLTDTYKNYSALNVVALRIFKLKSCTGGPRS